VSKEKERLSLPLSNSKREFPCGNPSRPRVEDPSTHLVFRITLLMIEIMSYYHLLKPSPDPTRGRWSISSATVVQYLWPNLSPWLLADWLVPCTASLKSGEVSSSVRSCRPIRGDAGDPPARNPSTRNASTDSPGVACQPPACAAGSDGDRDGDAAYLGASRPLAVAVARAEDFAAAPLRPVTATPCGAGRDETAPVSRGQGG
jgi:hypothetical protein